MSQFTGWLANWLMLPNNMNNSAGKSSVSLCTHNCGNEEMCVTKFPQESSRFLPQTWYLQIYIVDIYSNYYIIHGDVVVVIACCACCKDMQVDIQLSVFAFHCQSLHSNLDSFESLARSDATLKPQYCSSQVLSDSRLGKCRLTRGLRLSI